MKSRWLNVTHRGAFLAFLGLTLLGLGSTWADEADPPGRVARLSDLQGSVSLQPAGVQDWAAATLNRPLTTGDRLWADQDARAELAIGTQQMVTFAGTATVSYASATLGAPDELDSWSAGRERQRQESASRQYVAEDVPGMADLDTNGRWQATPDYGYVWAPNVVVAGWAPYRFGQWAWIAPWGWTWVDDAPWGYAPFHYGRWIMWNSAWCWVPGPRYVRPVYGPALVGWVGGPRGGVAVGIGVSVGWFPLAPREVYVPGYHVSETYVRNVNITNTTIVNNTYITNVYQNNVTNIHYVNATPGAVTAVPQNVFASGQHVARHVMPVSREVLSTAVTSAPPPVMPSRQAVLGAGAGRAVPHPPPAVLSRPVVATTKPPRAPVPFERQVEAIKANGGQIGRASCRERG